MLEENLRIEIPITFSNDFYSVTKTEKGTLDKKLPLVM